MEKIPCHVDSRGTSIKGLGEDWRRDDLGVIPHIKLIAWNFHSILSKLRSMTRNASLDVSDEKQLMRLQVSPMCLFFSRGHQIHYGVRGIISLCWALIANHSPPYHEFDQPKQCMYRLSS